MQKVTDFFKEGIWLIPLDSKRPVQALLIRSMRVIIGAIRGFVNDECFLKASALTFYSLLSVIPVVAVAFGVAKGFGFEVGLQQEIQRRFWDQPEVAQAIVDFSYSLLKHAEGGIIAGIGSVVLLWSVLKLLANIEHSLNAIWKVPNSRHFLRQFTDYLALMVLLPIFFVVSSSLTIYITSELRALAAESQLVHIVTPMIFTLFRMIPYVLSWLLFTLLYLLMPNTKVSWRAGIIAGVTAGTIYQIVQWVYIYFQIGVASYGAIYGSFAALPLFLLWIHLSWLIVLTGAEIAFNVECEELASAEPAPRILASERLLALMIAHQCLFNFKEGNGPTHIATAARTFGVPLNRARGTAHQLEEAGILSLIQDGRSDEQYQPARDLDTITLKAICDALNPSTEKKISIHLSNTYNDLHLALEMFEASQERSKANQPLLKIGAKP